MHIIKNIMVLGVMAACVVAAGAVIVPGPAKGTAPDWDNAYVVELADPALRSGVDMSTHKTTMKLSSDGQTLFVRAECQFPPGDNTLRGKPDAPKKPLLEDDSFEFFIAGDNDLDSGLYYHFAVDLCGDAQERKGLEPFKSGWKHAVSLGKDVWTAELAIPLESLGGVKPDGRYWRVNACRNVYGANGAFVEGLALARPGYLSPSELMVCGPVGADILLRPVGRTLAAMGKMDAYMVGPDRELFESLTERRGDLAAMKDGKLPVDEAVAVIGETSRTDTQVQNDIILNFMFGE